MLERAKTFFLFFIVRTLCFHGAPQTSEENHLSIFYDLSIFYRQDPRFSLELRRGQAILLSIF